MDIKQYLERQCALNSIRRGDIPRLLHYANSAKALRRYDAFVGGEIADEAFADRIRACPLLAGAEFDLALANTAHMQRANTRELLMQQELRKRIKFVPHVWFEHERKYPSPIFVVAMFGEEHFRKLDLPEEMQSFYLTAGWVFDVRSIVKDFIESNPNHRLLRGPFGRAVRVIIRDTYDHGFVYDFDTLELIGEYHTAPKIGMVTSTRRRKIKTGRRSVQARRKPRNDS